MIAYALTSRQRLIDYLELKNLTAAENNVLDRIIESVTAYIENYCGRRFMQTAYSEEVYDGTGTEILILKNFPISTTASFKLERRNATDNEDDWEEIDSDDYHIYYDRGEIVFAPGYLFAEYPRHYRVSYTAGYNFDAVAGSTYLADIGHGDLEFVAWKLAAKAWARRKGDPSVQSERLLNYSVTYETAKQVDPEIAEILDKYARYEA